MRDIIFISYSSKDADFVTKLVRDLEKQDIRCWMSSRDIEPGADYQGAIVSAMERSAAVLLVFSENANASKEIIKELALASQKNRTVIPARIMDIVPKGAFEYQITNAQFVDLFRDYNNAVVRLGQALRTQIAAAAGLDASPGAVYVAPKKLPSRTLLASGVALVVVLLAGSGAYFKFGSPGESQPQQSAKAPSGLSAPAVKAAPDATPAPAPTPTPAAPVATRPVAPVVAPSPQPVTVAPAAPVVQAPQPQPQPQPQPLPSIPVQPGIGVPEDLLKIAVTSRPDQRGNTLHEVFQQTDQLLSWEQALRLLKGVSSGARRDLIRTIAGHAANPIPVVVALNMLQFTDDFREPTLDVLDTHLPDDISAADAAALLGGLDQGQRRDAIRHVVNHIQTSLTADQALALLHATDMFWVSALEMIKSKLVQPQSGSDIVKLLGKTTDGQRRDAVSTLQGVLPETLLTADAVSMLRGTENFRENTLQLIGGHLPDAISTEDAMKLLEGLNEGNRRDGINVLSQHLKQDQSGLDVAPLLKQTENFRENSLTLLKPALAASQTVPSLLALLGTLSDGNRRDGLSTLSSFIPDGLTLQDAQALLQRTGDFYSNSLHLVAPHLAHLSPSDIHTLLQPISSSNDHNEWEKELMKLQ